jgi:hypothetical protein
MLSNQAIVLNAIANKNFEVGSSIELLAKQNPIIEKLTKDGMRNGFKAIELSRKCLTALNEIRNPKRSATFIKQQNNQLNLNGEQHGGKNMDAIAEGKATAFNPELETVAEYQRRND